MPVISDGRSILKCQSGMCLHKKPVQVYLAFVRFTSPTVYSSNGVRWTGCHSVITL